jgi:hemerythrin-like domain-containing protein
MAEPEGQPKVDSTPAAGEGHTEPEKPLPKLTPAEFRAYNRLAEHMDYYHNHFRSVWNTLMTACEKQKRPSGMSISQFLGLAEQFVSSLTMHHGIEERHFFPLLGKKMPAFKSELELVGQHREIHKGLDKLSDYLSACRSGETELRLSEMKKILDSFGKTLWQHLDDEVKQLGAENMRKYWTLEEMRRMPF